MLGSFTIFAMVAYVLLSSLGIMVNGFIVVLLGREWVRCHQLSPCDMILISLSASRLCLLWLGIIYNFYNFLHHPQYSKEFTHPYYGIYFDFLNMLTMWLATWLSVLFCVKIANFTHPIFLWLKWRIKGLVPWFLLFSLIISFIFSVLFLVANKSLYQAFSGNVTLHGLTRKLEIQYFVPSKLITLLIPFSLFVFSLVLLITSLWRHSWRMKHIANSAQDPSFQAHTRALKLLVSFLVLYTLSFMFFFIDATFSGFGIIWYWPWQIVIYLFTCIHPFIFILGNSQLGGALMEFLLLPKTFWNDKWTSSPS
ncbi:taste receptor type 2 member 41-like [Trichosurus vulpecula]|uniref:taste receptor type 2 member 41-like n=1 Tax=Trichosurus vulpecula TaxID=9337 RepID=UPI00186ADAA4|nr:taste receptor type 2 member 41-like [Trichosurus vulpecula]